MNEVMKTIIHRRSIRDFQDRQLSQEDLDVILEAGAYAPSARGRQAPLFAVCQNRELNHELGVINGEIAKEVMKQRPPMMPGGQPAAQRPANAPEVVDAFHGAPTVITIFAPKNWYNFTLDSAVAAQNMMLAADSVGVGSCLTARATEVFETERGKEIKAMWGIGDEYEAKLHIILGYPNGPIPEPKPRREGRVFLIK